MVCKAKVEVCLCAFLGGDSMHTHTHTHAESEEVKKSEIDVLVLCAIVLCVAFPFPLSLSLDSPFVAVHWGSGSAGSCYLLFLELWCCGGDGG